MAFPSTPLQPLLGSYLRPCHALTSKLPGTFRIVVTGDSYAYGLGVRAAETLPAQLGARLMDPSRRPAVEVLNLGCPGLNLFDEWAFVRQISDFVEHDLLLLILSRDDAIPWSRQEMERMQRDWRALWERQWDPAAEALPHAFRALGSLVREVSEQSRRVAVAFYEPVAQSGPVAMEVLRAACERLGVPFVDLVSPFRRFAADRLVVSEVDSHPNALAHRIAAAEVERTIRPLLPAQTAPEVEAIEAEFAARLQALEAAGADTPLVLEELYGWPSASLDEVDRFMSAHDGLLRSSLLLENLRAAEHQMGLLANTLAELERELLLASMSVPGTEERVDIAVVLAEMVALAATIPASYEVDGEPEAARGAEKGSHLEVWRSGSPRAARRPQMNRWTERATRRKRDKQARAEPLLASMRLLADGATALARRHADRAVGRPEALRLAREATAALQSMARACTPPSRHHFEVAIVVDAAIDASSDVDHASVTGVFETILPARREYRQIHYLRRDGRPLACWFDLPRGTVGRFRAAVKVWRGAEETTDVPARLHPRLVIGTKTEQYEGELIVVPCRRMQQESWTG